MNVGGVERRTLTGTFSVHCVKTLEVAKTRTTPYHPFSNGQVERYNTVVMQMVGCYIEKKNKLCDRDLPRLAMALHSMVNRQTGYTPNRLMLGRETVQPIHILLGTNQERMERFDLDSWIARLTVSPGGTYTGT
jgi:hypothetical protein